MATLLSIFKVISGLPIEDGITKLFPISNIRSPLSATVKPNKGFLIEARLNCGMTTSHNLMQAKLKVNTISCCPILSQAYYAEIEHVKAKNRTGICGKGEGRLCRKNIQTVKED